MDGAIPEPPTARCIAQSRKSARTSSTLRFNTAIAELIKFNNEMATFPAIPRELAENFTYVRVSRRISPRKSGSGSAMTGAWPADVARYDQAKLVESTMELPVQVNGKVRDNILRPAYSDERTPGEWRSPPACSHGSTERASRSRSMCRESW